MKYLVLLGIMMIAGFSYGQEDTAEETHDYYWGDLGGSASSFQGRGLLGLGAHAAIEHHLLSLQGSGSLNIDIFCPSGDISLEFYQVQYGYIRKYKQAFWYAKGGIGIASYRYAADTIPGTKFLECNEYRFTTDYYAALPIEIGAASTFDWFMIQVFGSVTFVKVSVPVYQLGLKFGFGRF